MPRYTDPELDRKDVIDIVRTKERLQARMELRRRLNVVENDVLEEFDRRTALGQGTSVDPWEVLRELEGRE